MNQRIDLRSDTVTKPTEGMLQAMFAAEVGDDVYGEDATVNNLEQQLAAMFGMEAGLFCPSGTMTNQIAIKVHTQPGNELICADNAHVFKYEGGGIAINSGVQARVIPATLGKITAPQIAAVINADDVHFPKTALVCLENTSNRGGGSVYEWDELVSISTLCKEYQLPLHLDGARVFNALVLNKYSAAQLGQVFQSVSVCLSKGLGAPVGSVLLGSHAFIKDARRVRKRLGGGMRQAGYLAAAGCYALEHHVPLLLQDHAHAQQIAAVLQQHPAVSGMLPVQTNIIIFALHSAEIAQALQTYLLQHGVLANKVSANELRFVFHLDITPAMVEQLAALIVQFKAS